MFKKKGTHSAQHGQSASTGAHLGKDNSHATFTEEQLHASNIFETGQPPYSVHQNPNFMGFNVGSEPPRLGLAYDIYQEGDSIIVEIPFPRLSSDTLSIIQENRLLKVSGTTEEPITKSTGKNATARVPLFIQTPRGYFEQVIQLPLAVQEEDTTATYENGVLTIVVKVIGAGRENKIQVSFA